MTKPPTMPELPPLPEPEGGYSDHGGKIFTPNQMDAHYLKGYEDAILALHTATQPCGHPASLVIRSAESGEVLYCEACDDKSGRRDAEMREAELLEANQKLRDEILALRPERVPMPEPVQRLRRYAGQTMRTARNPNITARDAIAIGDYLAAIGITQRADGGEVGRG